MAIKGGNPLFKVDVTPADDGFVLKVILPHNNEEIEQEITQDHPLYREFAMFGAETKTRNTIGAITDAAKRTPEGAYERAMAITQAFDEGKWNIGREAGDGAPSGGLVAQAVAKVLGKSVADVVAHIKGTVANIADDKARAKAMREAWDILEADADFEPTVAELREASRKARLAKVAAGGKAKSLLAGLKH